MSVAAVLTGVPTGLAGWKILQGKSPGDFKAFSKDPALQKDLAYLRDKLPTKLTSKSLLDDRRLQEMVLRAYGLDAQIGFNGLMRKVLDSDPADSTSAAGRMTDSRFRQLAADLNYGGKSVAAVPAVPSKGTLQVDWAAGGVGFSGFSGSFATVQVKEVPLDGADTRQKLAEKLQAAFRKADGGRADISVTAFGLELVFSDAKGRGASSFKFTPAVGSAATVTAGTSTTQPVSQTMVLEKLSSSQNLGSFTGTFGTVAVSGVSLKGLGTAADVAAALQAAFRKADGDRADISVKADGQTLTFTDARNRSNAQFNFAGQATAKLLTNTNGTAGTAATGGPKVASSTVVDAIVQKYTQARFEESLGETSETLRRAVYAKRTLPQTTSWYSVIADRNLAEVVQTVLGLPSSFGSLDVDQQKAALSKRMDIADFKDSTKLSKLLERYVAQTSISEAKALASSNGVVSLVQPVSWGSDSFSGASSAALFAILAAR
ncbi:DUF1217 domain-containing protein [Teichococcus vastitatis]|uniref:DUF1217 domain-containing protein n=1 Tax=Teichococcus vastitatis TaxID=2307076 RepID=UPI000E75B2D8|nr:DUF1217 domain-containing protein [Pseudoroseomonas vastitatis]